MIKKSVICCVVLLLLHLIFVLRYPHKGIVTHQWQANSNRAQQYMYEDSKDTVIVGSSLSERILLDSIPMVSSLSFSGCGVEDGLRIILCKGDVPKYILVESNIIFRNASPKLFSGITEGPMPILREWLPSLREKYEPICIYNDYFEGFYWNYLWEEPTLEKKKNKDENVNKSKEDEIFNSEIERHIKSDGVLSDVALNERLSTIKQLMNELSNRGAQFVFFEMPVNERVTNLKKHVQTRTVLKKEFPPSKYVYLPIDTAKYKTADGFHLNYYESEKFSHYFRKLLQEENIFQRKR